MQIHNLKRNTKNKKTPRVGRGGKRGKTSGRGTKGQLARSGRKLRPELRDIIKKLPKLRGRGKNYLKSVKKDALAVNVSILEKAFTSGDEVNPKILLEKGVIKMPKGERLPIKILATGEITKKLTVSGCRVSESAKEKIEKAGGVVSA